MAREVENDTLISIQGTMSEEDEHNFCLTDVFGTSHYVFKSQFKNNGDGTFTAYASIAHGFGFSCKKIKKESAMQERKDELHQLLQERTYLGDGLDAQFDGYAYELYSSNIEGDPKVFLGPQVLSNFDAHRKRCAALLKELNEIDGEGK